tara:strand:+ start:59 stop:748 length:690 start_codon:yes stop_codon:yes gene_type:complete
MTIITIDSGFIKLQRKILDWEWYDDIPTKTLFIHILLKANFLDKTWRGVSIKRGEFLTGRKELAKETGLSEQQIKTALNKLKSTQEITIKVTNKFSIIKVENYYSYQDKKNDSNQQTTQPTTNNQTTIKQQSTTTKNEKKEKNEKKVSKFTKPTLKEVEDYNNSRGDLVDSKKFFDYYEAGNWTDQKGNKIKNWKQKLITWEKRSDKPKSDDSFDIVLKEIQLDQFKLK